MKLQKSIVKPGPRVLAATEHDLSNALIESINTTIRLLTRVAFVSATPQPVIALRRRRLGGHQPTLPAVSCRR